ncbi:MAG: hypothetical protein NUV49_02260 [Patescibacteria group bacterium]|nr:hypothetical protein [Patescibacteria group bacterium]
MVKNIKKIIHFFDKLEDKTRAKLSRKPILYALIGGVGLVLFWRGVWHTADSIMFLNGPVSIVVGTIILLMTGVFVSTFIGNKLIITGLSGAKKIDEKTKEEVEAEESQIKNIQGVLKNIEHELSDIKSEMQHDDAPSQK